MALVDPSVYSMILARKLCHSGATDITDRYSSPNKLERDFNTTVKALGLPYATDLTCGNPAGLAPVANTRSGNTRTDACRCLQR
jgi:hypothetical protein